MPCNRTFTARYRASWLALLAMFLLNVGPLWSQLSLAVEPALQAGPDCVDHASSHEQMPDHEVLWAKCGYCTLLLNSPATSCASPLLTLASTTVADRHAVPVRSGVVRSAIFPGSRSRAPPVYS